MKENKDKKEIWEQKVKASKTRQYSFDTVSGKINKLLYYPENLDDHYLDGNSLVDLAKGNDNHDDRVIFWEYLDQTAVRKGKWKLVLKGKLIDAYGPVPDVHLANLEEDISESNNLADKEPEITAELTKLAENWRSKIEDKWIKDYGAPSEAQRLNTQMGLR